MKAISVSSGGGVSCGISFRCTACPVAERAGGPRPVLPEVGRRPICLLVGEAPGREEEETGRPFVGRSGRFLREALRLVGIDESACAIANAVLCPPRSSTGSLIGNPSQKDALHCLPHALSLLPRLRPRAVLAIGKVSAQVLTGSHRKGITHYRGEWFPLLIPFPVEYACFRLWAEEKNLDFPEIDPERDEITAREQMSVAEEHGYSSSWLRTPVLPVLHPAYILRQEPVGVGQHTENFISDLRSFHRRVEGISEREEEEGTYRLITTPEDWTAYVDETLSYLGEGVIEVLACDTEVVSKEPPGEIGLLAHDPKARLLSIQFSRFNREAVVVLLHHREGNFHDDDSFRRFLHDLRRLLREAPLVFHNATFDLNLLRSLLGIRDIHLLGDTLLMEHWLSCGKGYSMGLDALGKRYLGTGGHKSPAHRWQEEHPESTMEDWPDDIFLKYAADDAALTLRLFVLLREKLRAENRWGAYQDFYHGKHGAFGVILDLEHHGQAVERTTLDALRDAYPKRIEETLCAIHGSFPVLVHCLSRLRQHNEEAASYNEELAREFSERMLSYQREPSYTTRDGKTRKRPRPRRRRQKRLIDIPLREGRESVSEITPEEIIALGPVLRALPEVSYNPNSVPQTISLWKSFGVPVQKIPNIEYAEDDACLNCGKYCRCSPPHKPTRFKTNAHNRDILAASCRLWSESARREGREDAEGWWADVAEALVLIGRYKDLVKSYGTYVEGIYPLIVDRPEPQDTWDPRSRLYPPYKDTGDLPRPWTIHPSYLMHGTRTGRLSSVSPNATNFPSLKLSRDLNVKAPYVSRYPGGLLVMPDMKQIEVLVLVVLSQDERLQKALEEGRDIHTYVASLVHQIPEEQVTKDLRAPVKKVTFGTIYGQSVDALAVQLGIPKGEAQLIQDRFFEALPKTREYIERQHRTALEKGLVFSPIGRVRYLPAVGSTASKERKKVLREAVNTPIQGIASDVNWSAFGRSWRTLKRLGIEASPYSIIHDQASFDTSRGTFFDVMEVQLFEMTVNSRNVWPFLTVTPGIDFDLAVSWGCPVQAKLFPGRDGSIDHHRLALLAYREDVESVTERISEGDGVTVIVDREHPRKEEAERGMWYREILIERPSPRCLFDGTSLRTT